MSELSVKMPKMGYFERSLQALKKGRENFVDLVGYHRQIIQNPETNERIQNIEEPESISELTNSDKISNWNGVFCFGVIVLLCLLLSIYVFVWLSFAYKQWYPNSRLGWWTWEFSWMDLIGFKANNTIESHPITSAV